MSPSRIYFTNDYEPWPGNYTRSWTGAATTWDSSWSTVAATNYPVVVHTPPAPSLPADELDWLRARVNEIIELVA